MTTDPGCEYIVVEATNNHGVAVGLQGVRVHPRSVCEGREIPCCIHSPSNHHMRDWEQLWRDDKSMMERICPHGIGHPDPDHMAWVRHLNPENVSQGVHGCDGCCHRKGKKTWKSP